MRPPHLRGSRTAARQHCSACKARKPDSLTPARCSAQDSAHSTGQQGGQTLSTSTPHTHAACEVAAPRPRRRRRRCTAPWAAAVLASRQSPGPRPAPPALQRRLAAARLLPLRLRSRSNKSYVTSAVRPDNIRSHSTSARVLARQPAALLTCRPAGGCEAVQHALRLRQRGPRGQAHVHLHRQPTLRRRTRTTRCP